MTDTPVFEFRHRIAVSEIQATVCTEFGISLIDMASERRARPIARPRQIAIYLARHLTRLGLSDIGRRFNRDHTTVIHAIEQVERLMAEDDQFAARVASLMDRFRNRPIVDSSALTHSSDLTLMFESARNDGERVRERMEGAQ